jgi:hypothetical protein
MEHPSSTMPSASGRPTRPLSARRGIRHLQSGAHACAKLAATAAPNGRSALLNEVTAAHIEARRATPSLRTIRIGGWRTRKPGPLNRKVPRSPRWTTLRSSACPQPLRRPADPSRRQSSQRESGAPETGFVVPHHLEPGPVTAVTTPSGRRHTQFRRVPAPEQGRRHSHFSGG